MRDNQAPKAIHLSDYQAPPYLIEQCELDVRIHDGYTLVRADLQLRKQADSAADAPLRLDGADLELVSVAVDGVILGADQYTVEAESLTLPGLPAQCVLTIETRICPEKNTSLEGLYQSKGLYCTQCEAEGFRKITYYLDRPDVMARFRTRVEADRARCPVLLSNGNPVDEGDAGNGRHFVVWEDPFKKPCYLFALVAGDLAVRRDTFTTCSGREIALEVYVEPRDLEKCDHAIASLQRAMAWDEQQYGREYDLDIYMIVAVSHFNMGAMENKGLNIFNTSCVLASPNTTTDQGFERVESVIAHEYFHNWSGNRVTCRDWFQLSLKEGFTVLRDQQFSAAMGAATVKRIEDVTFLRTVQFAEDAGPMAHPVRPDSYIEINNFYTVTVYEKGAEVVRMMHTLVGDDAFRQGTDLYFERHDGQAVTCEDFVAAIETASGRDLTQFRRWYSQAGTPCLSVSTTYDADQRRLSVTLSQQTSPTPGQPEKLPLHIPVRLGLLSEAGTVLACEPLSDGVTQRGDDWLLELTAAESTFEFGAVEAEPVISLLRGFSAPVKLQFEQSDKHLRLLMQHDTDGFNRWASGQQLMLQALRAQVDGVDTIESYTAALAKSLGAMLRQVNVDDEGQLALMARLATLPSEQYLAGVLGEPVAVDAIAAARQALESALADALAAEWLSLYDACQLTGPYEFTPLATARRAMANVSLSYLMRTGSEAASERCLGQFAAADCMTNQLAALKVLVHADHAQKAEVLDQFYQQWRDEALVVDQWFMIQATAPGAGTLEHVEGLLQHEAFELTNPNKVRSLIASFCSGNPVNFHRADGAGYRFLADQVIALNRLNPQIAARLVGLFNQWRRYSEERQNAMQAELQRILAEPLSPDVYEVVSKALAPQSSSDKS